LKLELDTLPQQHWVAYLSLEDVLCCLSKISGVSPDSVVHFLRRQKYPVKVIVCHPLAGIVRGIPQQTVKKRSDLLGNVSKSYRLFS
jgi:hypothetical protein